MQDLNEGGPRLGRRRRRRLGAMLLSGVLLLGACGDSDDDPGEGASASEAETGGEAGAAGLGAKDPASGEPVKIGFVSDGRTQTLDNSNATVVAEAMVEYLNDYRGGFGGRPIELHKCDSLADPAKSADCANELIQADVVMTILPSLATLTEVWRPLHEAGIPTFIYSTTDKEVMADTETTFAVTSPTGSLIGMPISTAKKAKAKKVVGVIVDVPAATAIYEDQGEDLFAEEGLDFELVKIPLGQPDLTPQMLEIAAQDDVAVHIVGTDAMAIAALNGLEAGGFEGAISCLGCDAESVVKARGAKLEGIVIGAQGSVVGDSTDVDLYHAIMEEYAPNLDKLDDPVPLYTYIAWAAARDGLEGLEGEFTAESIIETFRSMPNMRLRTFGESKFRCNGKADPVYPAACANSVPIGVLDETGTPTNIAVTNTKPIPD
jgi:branched-chain amino acid transport system substrate-binding protein